MKAYTIQKFNELPSLVEKEVPIVDGHKSLIRVMASALNHRDVWITKGLYPGIVIGATMGSDCCGIDENGQEVIINPGISWGNDQRFQAKDFRVLGVPDDGTFADYISIDHQYVYPKPFHLSSQEAAALPLAGLTAYRALIKRADLQPEDKVLISGVGGGVALFGLQIAISLGCEVYVTSGSSAKIQKAIDLGARGGYLYREVDWSKKLMHDSGGIDVVLDSAGGSGFHHFIQTAKPGGRIVFYGGTHGKIEQLNLQPIFWKQLSLLGSTMGSDSDFADMLAFVALHRIKPVIDSVNDFDDLGQAFQRMAAGDQFGKIVINH
ncbi:MAG: zinc-binding dehydrogenase [Saprospiraceae bacterium]|jgi:NADPH:quinone reductase-like Zn-dependent oxidoreductase